MLTMELWFDVGLKTYTTMVVFNRPVTSCGLM